MPRSAVLASVLVLLLTAGVATQTSRSFAGVCQGLEGTPGDVDGDGFQPVDDCAPDDPSVWVTPAEVQNLLIEEDFDGAKVVVWDGTQGARSNLYRSTSPQLTSTDCLAPALQSPMFKDLDDPLPNQVFYYLAQDQNDCGTGDVGTDSAGIPRAQLACDCSTLCDDGDACTVSVCSGAQCTNEPIAPLILTAPKDVTACAGLGADFHVQAGGSGILSYQWFIDGLPVGTNDPSLMLSSVGLGDDGSQITVEVTDGCSSATAGPATLSVFADPSSCIGGLAGYEAPNQGYNGRPHLHLATGATISAADFLTELPGYNGRPHLHLATGATISAADFLTELPGYNGRPHLHLATGATISSISLALHSGENTFNETDLSVPGRGFDFHWYRTYRSREPNDSAQGRNWVHSYARRIEWATNPGGPLLLHDGARARIDVYEPDPQLQNCWTSPGFFRTLCLQPDQRFVLTFADKHEWVFRPLNAPPFDGQIEAEVDRNGNAMFFNYDGAGRLDQIVDTLGRPYQIIYNPDDFIESIVDFTGRTCTYDYYEDGDAGGSAGDLKSVTSPAVTGTPNGNDFPNGKTTTYTYTTGFADEALNHNLLTITDPKGQTYIDFGYTGTGLPADARYDRLDHVTLPNGVVSFVYVQPPFNPQFPTIVSGTIVNDRAGNVAEYFFDADNRIILERQFTGRADASRPTDGTTNRPGPPLRPTDPPVFETVAQYNADSLPTFVQYGNGNQLQLQYDSINPDPRFRANLLQRTRLPGPLGGDQGQITESWTYNTDFGTRDAAKGLHHLHAEGVIHRDLAARNVLNPPGWPRPGGNRRSSSRISDVAPIPGIGGGTGSGMGTLLHGADYKDVIRATFKSEDFVAFVSGPGDGGAPGGTRVWPKPGYWFPSTYTDGRGLQYVYTYDTNGNLDTATAPVVTTGVLGGGQQVIVDDFEHNTFGQMTRHTTPANRVDRFTYYTNGPRQGYLQDVIVDDPGFALTTTYNYDPLGRVIRITDPRGNDTEHEYNALDQIVRETSRAPFLYETDLYYDANDNVVRVDRVNRDENDVFDANSHLTTTYAYDILDRRIREQTETGDDGQCFADEFEYDANDNLVRHSGGEATNGNDPDNVVRAEYDERELVFRVTRGFGSPDQSTTQYDYDSNRNLRGVREGMEDPPNSNDTILQYDGYDRLVRVEDEESNESFRVYDANGRVIELRVEGEELQGSGLPEVPLSERDFIYDEINRRVSTQSHHYETGPAPTTPIGDGLSSTQWFYDLDTRLIRIENDNGHATTHDYDSARRVRLTTDAAGNSTRFVYDGNSNVLSVTETDLSDLGSPPEIFVTSYVYDTLDRKTRKTDNAGSEWDYDYDSRHNLRLFVDSRDNVTRLEYDGADRVVRSVQELTSTGTGAGSLVDTIELEYCWDDSSRRTCMIDDNDNTTTYTYDSLDRRVRIDFADGTDDCVIWDIKDNAVGRTDPNGTVETRTYDGLDRLVSNSVTPAAGVTGPLLETFSYDGLSRIVRAENDDSVVTRTYDSLSFRVEETLRIGSGPVRVTSSSHDGIGNVTGMTYPSGYSVTMSYDALERLESVTSAGSSAAIYRYFGPRVERVERPGGYRTDYEFDSLRRITRVHSHDTSTTISDHVYTYDPVHSTTSRTDQLAGGPARTFEYDSADRLSGTTNSGAASVDYTLDGVGNRTLVTGGPDAGTYTLTAGGDLEMNQYSSTPNGARTYDASGNLTLSTDTSGVSQYAYDYRDLMTQATVPGQPGPVTHTYTYDALGRRIVRNDTSEPTEHRYYYDGIHVVEEQDENDAERITNVYGPGIDEPLELRLNIPPGIIVDNSVYMDAMHVVAVQDTFTGSVRERYRYGDYGDPQFLDPNNIPMPASSIANSYLFTGRRWDPETGFYYYRARYLDPHAGRFTARDPLGIWGGSAANGNGATYAGGNPWSNPGARGDGDHNGNGELKVIVKSQKIAGGSVDDGVIRDFDWTQLDGPYGTKAGGVGGAGGGVGKAVRCPPRPATPSTGSTPGGDGDFGPFNKIGRCNPLRG